MNDIEIIDIDKNSKIFIFSIEKNISILNQSIIPKEQLDKIEKYQKSIDKTKRILARSFLFEYCQKKYNLKDFSFEYINKQRPIFKNSELDFSISYSKDIIAIALSNKHTIGLDIEFSEVCMVKREVAQEFMSDIELLTFMNLGKKDRVRYFYEIWTSKESLLKCSGDGLYINPKIFTNDVGKFLYYKNYVINFTIM